MVERLIARKLHLHPPSSLGTAEPLCYSPGSDSRYRHIDCKIAPPVCSGVPDWICLKRTSMSSNSLLKAALLKGAQFTRPQIEKRLSAERIPFPAASGTGAGGRLLKSDLVDVLLARALAGVPADEVARIRKKLCRESTTTDDGDEDDPDACPEELLHLLRNLDLENREHFRNVTQHATRLLERRS